MYQNKSHVVAFEPAFDDQQRLDALAQALIDQGVPSGHQLFAQAPGLDNLPIGRWPDVECLPEDWRHATSVLITW